MSDDADICGYEGTTTGRPCQNPAGSCPVPSHTKGRPTKFTKENRKRILTAAESGTTVDGCARAAGIGASTLYDWLNKYPDFSDRFYRARAKGEQRLLASEDVPATFILERSYDYVKTEKREIDMDANHNIDAAEGVTAEFVTFRPEEDGDD